MSNAYVEISKDIASKRWLAIFLAGLFVFLIGAGGGLSILQLKDSTWRIVVAAVGLIVAGIGLWGKGIGADFNKTYGLKITNPGENANLPKEFRVEGTYEEKPPDGVAMLFVLSTNNGSYWPSRRFITFDEVNKKWSSTLHISGDVGQEKIIGIAIAGPDSQKLFEYYKVVADWKEGLQKKLNEYIGVPGVPRVPADFKECHSIRVKRV